MGLSPSLRQFWDRLLVSWRFAAVYFAQGSAPCGAEPSCRSGIFEFCLGNLGKLDCKFWLPSELARREVAPRTRNFIFWCKTRQNTWNPRDSWHIGAEFCAKVARNWALS